MKWLLRISNAHQELSHVELAKLLSDDTIEWLNPLLGVVNTDEEQIKKISNRTYSIRTILKDLTIIKNIEGLDTNLELLPRLSISRPENSSSFAVRAFNVMNHDSKIPSPKIERVVGSIIKERYPNLSVNLDHPDATYYVYLWRNGLVSGWLYKEILYSSIAPRAPKESPFFGGGAMKPLLCRILVNLLYPNDPVIMDPFCGQGGILREIADTSSYAIGIEVSTRVIRECKINNKYHGYDGMIALIQGDALSPPLRTSSIFQVVSDPPYALQTTTKGLDPDDLFRLWMDSQEQGLTAVITLPKSMQLLIGQKWEMEFAIEDFVHKSLIRVARKMRRVE